ncbi:MAG: flavin reductase family protein [Firmicutes bacterium]|nr:flavin reductase family protein [Bacillota bacterium]
MSKLVWKSGALLAPVPPAMVSCRYMERSNIITVAWTGILCTKPAKTYVSIRPTRFSYNIIKESGECVINLTTAALAGKADWCGTYTGAKVDKFKSCGLTEETASKVSCPLIGESPLSIECKVTDIVPLGSHDMFICDIVAVDVDEKLIDKSGKLHLDKAGLAAYAHGQYYELGRKIGTFGFSVRKSNSKKR